MAKDNISNSRALDLIGRALEVEALDAQEAGQVGYMPRVLVQTTLPYRDPKTMVYKRQNGDLKLSLLSPNGVPYGSIPRFLVSYLASEAVIKGSPQISLGHSQNEFVSMLGMHTAGGAIKARMKEQCKRFFTSMLSMEVHKAGSNFHQDAMENILVAKKAFIFWHPKEHDQPTLWESTMTLTDDFFNECIKHPVPIDMCVMDVLSSSPMAMDVYVWMTWRVARASKASTLPWEMLMLQFGTKEGTETRTFRRSFIRALKLVETASGWHPSISVDDDGLTVFPGNPHVKPLPRK